MKSIALFRYRILLYAVNLVIGMSLIFLTPYGWTTAVGIGIAVYSVFLMFRINRYYFKTGTNRLGYHLPYKPEIEEIELPGPVREIEDHANHINIRCEKNTISIPTDQLWPAERHLLLKILYRKFR